jgi:hypothetical protein
MKFRNKSFAILAILALTAVCTSLSCQLKDPDNYDVNIIVMANGSTVADYNKFTATFLVDDKPPITLTSIPDVNGQDITAWLYIPCGNIKTATITATRVNSDASLSILIYKNNELDQKGVALLATCNATSTTSCSNTLNLVYKVDQQDADKTKSASTATTNKTSTTTTTTP